MLLFPRANGAERRSGRKPAARVLIPSGYLHPGKGTDSRSLKFIKYRGRMAMIQGWTSPLISKIRRTVIEMTNTDWSKLNKYNISAFQNILQSC
jgi:hypothetical protein